MLKHPDRKMSRVKIKLPTMLTSVPDGDELSDSTSIPFITGKRYPAPTGQEAMCTTNRRWTWRRTCITRQMQSACDGLTTVMLWTRVLFGVKPCGPKATDVSTALRSFETSANYLTNHTMWYPRSPENTTIRVVKARRAICICGCGRRNKFIQYFGRKNGTPGRSRCKWIGCENVKWIRLTSNSPVKGGSRELGATEGRRLRG